MATATVDEKDAERLQKLHPDHQAAVMQEYQDRTDDAAAAAGGRVPPEVQRQLMQAAIEKVADDEEAADRRRRQEAGVHLDMVAPPVLQIGKYRCRPFSAAVVVILETIGHPVMTGDETTEMTMEDLVVLLFVFCCEDERQLVRLSRAGAEAMAEEAAVWSFGLGVAELQAMGQEAMAMVERTTNGDEPGNRPTAATGTG